MSFVVRVVPRASKNQVVGLEGEQVKIRLTAPPVEGKANDALVKFLASLLSVPRSSIEILAGQTSKTKTIAVRGLTADQVAHVLLNRQGGPSLKP